ncbi:MAG: hypothetical protein KOO60_03745, partial [Gemmatimonadales bacterium]|nr:hypothetical protein [Gemmatimonadales bacterium]
MTRNRSILFAGLVFLLVSAAPLSAAPLSQAPDHHALVQLYLDSPGAPEFLESNRGRLDVLLVKPGIMAHLAAQPEDLKFLEISGQRFDILEPDMEDAYAGPDKAEGFGIYHTFPENIAFVDSLHLLYPDVISQKWSIGKSVMNQDLWCFRVSDNPEIDEIEPEILIDGMHHAREIMASEFPIMFAEYLAQNYGTDPEITWLLNNRELYIIPIVNPDGLLFNEATHPGGGGMWRKNRRDNDDGTYGVDPNRNYPYMWGYDDSGSSPDPVSEVYRGPSAGSEPEVQAMMSFMNSREFVTHNTVHTYGNLTLYPWGYTTVPSADTAIFTLMGAEMCKYNGYIYGTPVEAINYAVNGGTIDWAYGAVGEHTRIFSFSNEIGGSSDGFWPDESRRGPLFLENIWPNQYLMRAAGSFVVAHSATTTPVAKNIGPGQSGLLDFTVASQSPVAGSAATNLTITSDDAWLQLDEGLRSTGALPPLTETTLGGNAIPFSVEAGCPDGHFAIVHVAVHMPEGDLSFDLPLLVGSPGGVLIDDMESGADNWTLTGNWALSSEEAHSGTLCLSDSPGAAYQDNESYTATVNGSFLATRISFWNKYSIEEGWDYGRLQISTDNGPWTTVYTCTGTLDSWELVEVDLADYLGRELRFRFLLETDSYVTDNGWWIDDLTIEGVNRDNLAPSTPEPAPVSGLPSSNLVSPLAVINCTDPEGEPLTYGFRVYADDLCTQPVLEATDVPEGDEITEWTPTGLPDGTYYWRAWAFDGVERSLLSEVIPFSTDSGSAIGQPVIASPFLKVLTSV